MRKFYIADFETRSSEEDIKNESTSVWLWDICDENFKHINGNDIESFFKCVSNLGGCIIYFHNLKFDIQFIQFTKLLSDKGGGGIQVVLIYCSCQGIDNVLAINICITQRISGYITRDKVILR